MNTEIPLAWPNKKSNQKWGLFYYEASSEFSMISENSEVQSRFDFRVTPQKDAEVQVTLMCDWGYPRTQFVVLPPPSEVTDVLIADFRGVTPSSYGNYFADLRSLMPVATFAGPHQNRQLPEERYTLPQRIIHMSQYRFVLISETIFEENWYGIECDNMPT